MKHPKEYFHIQISMGGRMTPFRSDVWLKGELHRNSYTGNPHPPSDVPITLTSKEEKALQDALEAIYARIEGESLE